MFLLGAVFGKLMEDSGSAKAIAQKIAVTLGHNGAVITLLVVCGLTHRQSKKDVATVSLVIPLLATVIVVVLGTWFGSF